MLDTTNCGAQEVVEAPKKMGPDALLKDKFKANRQRQGYEEGISTTRRTAPATSFVLSEAPVEMLGRFTRFADLWSDTLPRAVSAGVNALPWHHAMLRSCVMVRALEMYDECRPADAHSASTQLCAGGTRLGGGTGRS